MRNKGEVSTIGRIAAKPVTVVVSPGFAIEKIYYAC